jgi:hypothetical protein
MGHQPPVPVHKGAAIHGAIMSVVAGGEAARGAPCAPTSYSIPRIQYVTSNHDGGAARGPAHDLDTTNTTLPVRVAGCDMRPAAVRQQAVLIVPREEYPQQVQQMLRLSLGPAKPAHI